MDSSITSSAESKQEVVSIVSSESPKSTQTSTTAPQQTPTSSTAPKVTSTSTQATVGVSSVSNTTVGVSSVGGGGATSQSGGGAVKYVRKWGTSGAEYYHPTQSLEPASNVVWLAGGYYYTPGKDDMGAVCKDVRQGGILQKAVDFQQFQHSHDIPSHSHYVPAHSHSIALNGHSHTVTLKPHSHTMEVPAHQHTVTIQPHSHEVSIPSHTHTVNGSVTIPAHSHTLNEGVKVSSTNPNNVKFKINGTEFCTVNGINSSNNIDITDKIRIGEWNTIEITASTVARAVVYGTVELIAI